MTLPLSRHCAGLALFALAAAPAQAQAAQPYAKPSAERIFESKASAILGGAPSRLAMIRSQQRGEVAVTPIRPASLNVPVVRRAVLQSDVSVQRTAWTGRPDVFGSVALKVDRTKLDHRFKRAVAAPMSTAAVNVAEGLKSMSPVDRVKAVNRYVNDKVEFTDDWRQFGRADRWASAAETLRRGRGDCEDYALTKMQMLRAAGIPSKDLYLVLVRDLVRQADHAVLIVRTEGRTLLLDNGTDQVHDAETVRDYRPIFTFASTGTWTHGYRRGFDAPLQVASLDTKVEPASEVRSKPIDGTDLALLQRSRSASLRAFMTGFSK